MEDCITTINGTEFMGIGWRMVFLGGSFYFLCCIFFTSLISFL